MATETELILESLSSIHEDVRQIRDKVDSQGEKINDLCTRTALTDEQIKNHVKNGIKKETKAYKFISMLISIGSGLATIYYYVKSAGLH